MTLPTEHWAAQADYDLSVADLLYQQGVYRYCVFFCHLALEKRLKAILLERTGRSEPPYTHRLNNLARRAGVNLSNDYRVFMQDLTDHSTAARYPSSDTSEDIYSKDSAERILNQTREVYEWLNSRTAS